MKLIRILIPGLIMLLPFASHAFADGGAVYVEKVVDGQTVGMAFTDGNVKVGDNKISIHIRDAQGKPVTNAKVSVVAEMYPEVGGSTMGGMNMGGSVAPTPTATQTPMQTIKTDLTAGQQSGEYEGDLNLDEAGHWMITVHSTVGQQTTSAEFTQEVSKGGPNVTVLAMFFGAIVAIIGVAAITRKKRAKVPVTEGN